MKRKLEQISEALNQDRVQYGIMILISAAFLFTRLFRLGSIPSGMNADEMGSAYDGFCVAHFGVDRYLAKYPIYFKNFGGGQNALMAYLAALLSIFTHFSVLKYRLLPVILAAFAFICTYLLGRQVFEKKKYALIAPSLMVIMPEFLMSERWALESNLFLSMTLISLYFLMLAYKKQKPGWFFLSGSMWGLTYFTYGISYAQVTLFLLIIFVVLLYFRQINPIQTICFLLPLLSALIPLLLQQLVAGSYMAPFHLLLSDITTMEYFRIDELSFVNIPSNIDNLFFIFSHDWLSYNADPRYGTVLYISVPFIVIGIVFAFRSAIKSLREKKFDFSIILSAHFLTAVFVALITEQLNINRANELFASLLFLSAYGIIYFWEKTEYAPIVISILYLAFFLPFASFYYRGSGYDQSIWESEGGGMFHRVDLSENVRELIGKGYEVCIMDNPDRECLKLQLALFNEVSPYDFQSGDDMKNYHYWVGLPEDLDLSGKTAYITGKDIHHVADYLASCGFTVDDSVCEDYSVSFIP